MTVERWSGGTVERYFGALLQIGRSLAVIALCAGSIDAQIPPSVEFRVPKPPTLARNDSGPFVAYELHVTNLTTNPLRLSRVEILDGATRGGVLSSLSDSALVRSIARPGLPARAPDRTILGAGLRAIVYVWMQLDPNKTPTTLSHRLTLQRPADSAARADTMPVTLQGTLITIDRRIAEISPPLRGRWVALNGPSNTSGHRRLVLGLNGSVASGQRFAIDFLEVDDQGRSTRTDRSKNENFYAYGKELYAVADGNIVETKDGIPENDPSNATNRAVPINLETVGGNHIVIDIGNGHYAFYAHLKPGSLRVKVGDRVKRGQVIGLLGNSGNSTEPHLHFHISDALAAGTTTLGSEGIPYALPSFELVARCTLTTSISCPALSPPITVRNGMPMENQMMIFR